MEVKMKTVVTYKMHGVAETHARTKVNVRDLVSLVDEPAERGGSNQAPSPTETMIVALIGCTNVITQKIAKKHGVEIKEMSVDAQTKFDRRGVILEEEVTVPFPEINLTINLKTEATEAEIEIIKTDLKKFCAISKVIRESGTIINEEWRVQRP
ncbi:MAG: OsmC family protein [SAR324 cluster bacterium]|nr:OsmC family protein [SAR324 cluster bacterium]